MKYVFNGKRKNIKYIKKKKTKPVDNRGLGELKRQNEEENEEGRAEGSPEQSEGAEAT